jgi:CDP-paratose 2-epimerase
MMSTSRRVLITGGAGFVGSSLALDLAAAHPDWELTAVDNLYRRGSELSLPRLKAAGVAFHHADVRFRADLDRLGGFDAMVECSAEPSAFSGSVGDADFVVHSNLLGAHNCLAAAAANEAQFVFVSTSRVYPIAKLESLSYREAETRFELDDEQPLAGASGRGIAEDFPLDGARTLYGATKLAAELLVAEHAATHGLPTVVNRCGTIAGPWQFGKVDQGVFTHWVRSFLEGRPLRYIGYGGRGKQVRDMIHAGDFARLIELQLSDPRGWDGRTFNVGGGLEGSLSLVETTELCWEITGRELDVSSEEETRPGDVPVYVSDCGALFAHTDWRPQQTPRDVLAEIAEWAAEHREQLAAALD